MHPQRIAPPEGFPLLALRRDGDFLDCWRIAPARDGDAAALARIAVEGMPGWARRLLALRDRLVAPLGLKTAKDLAQDRAAPRIGFMQIHETHEDAVVLGEDDRHLDFRVAVMRCGDAAVMGTWVRPKTRFGKAYLRAVTPFHDMIVRNGLRRMGRR